MRQSYFQKELLFDLNDVLTNHFYSGTKLAKIENLEHTERERICCWGGGEKWAQRGNGSSFIEKVSSHSIEQGF